MKFQGPKVNFRNIFSISFNFWVYLGFSLNFTVAAKSIGHLFYATLSFVCHFAATALDFQGLRDPICDLPRALFLVIY